MQDEQQERQRSLALKRQQEERTLAVGPTAFLCTPLGGCSAAVSMVRCRWSRAHPERHSHVVFNRGNTLDVYALHWTRSIAVDNESASIDEQAASASGGEWWSLSLSSVAQPPVLGHIQQLEVLTWTDARGRAQDLLLLTSDSGYMSLLAFEEESDDGQTDCDTGVGRLRALAHTRLGHPGVSRRQLGAFLRVSEEGPPAIAVASMEASHPARSGSGSRRSAATGASEEGKNALQIEPGVVMDEAVDWTHGEGGILVYPIRATQVATPAASGGDSVAMAVDEGHSDAPSAAAASSSSSLPNLGAPITVPFDGVLTALRFLPPSSSQPDKARLLLAVVPPVTAARDPVRTQLIMVSLNFAEGSFVSTLYPLQLQTNEMVLDILVVNPRPAAAPVAAASASASSGRACFVLLQLETRVLLLDVDSCSTLHFPASISLPAWADVAADQTLQRSVGSVPLLTCWSWIGERRLACVSETGDVHLLHLWWNDADDAAAAATGGPPMPPATADAGAWMRFVPLGLATPSACMLALSAPASSAAASASAADLLLLPGEGAEGMLLRIDWPTAQHNIRSSAQAAAAYSSSSAPPLPFTPEPALQRESYLPNLSPLLDFVACNTTLQSPFPSASPQVYCVGGLGRHGALRVSRPNTVEGELLEAGGEGDESAGGPGARSGSNGADHKIFQALLPLRSRNNHSHRIETLALVYSFVGSTRVRAMVNGALDDVSEGLAAGGVELNRTTLDAALVTTAQGARVMLQVDDRSVRAVLLHADSFAGQRLLDSWTPPTAAATAATEVTGLDSTLPAAHFTHAHISDDGEWILLSLPASRSVLLLSHQFDPVACRSVLHLRGQVAMGSDVSALCVTTLASSSGTTAPPLCMVATHDQQLHFFQPAASPPPSATAAHESGATAAPDLLHYHQTDLKHLLPSVRESDLSAVAESLLLCSTTTKMTDPSRPQQQHHLFIGLRDGHLIRAALHPHGSAPSTATTTAATGVAGAGVAAAGGAALTGDESGWLRQCVVRRLGAARVKLARLDSSDPRSSRVVLLALCDRAFVVESPLCSDVSRHRQTAMRVRELVWPWSSPAALNTSTALQFAAPFTQSDPSDSGSAVGVACVIDGQFHLIEIDLYRSDYSCVSRAFPLGGTPRRVLHHAPSNLLCILTLDHTPVGPHSRLLLVDPLTGALLHEYDFNAAAKDRTEQVAAHSMCLWQQASGRTVLLVGGALRKHAASQTSACLFCFALEWRRDGAHAQGQTGASGSSAPVPMDLSDAHPTPAAASRASSSSSSSSSRHPTLVPLCSWSSRSSATRCATSICLYSSTRFLVATDTHLMLMDLGGGSGGTDAVRMAQATALPVPVVDIWSLPADPRSGQPALLALTDQRRGVSLATVDAARQGKITITHTDPCARIARQAIAFRARANMQPAHTLPPQQVGTPITVAQDNAAVALAAAATGTAASASSSPSPPVASIVRVIGFDVFGRVFVLRQDVASEAALVRAAKRTAVAAPHAAAAAAAAAASPIAGPSAPPVSSSSSSSASRPPAVPFTVSTSLVQEASFQLGSTPSRVRMLDGSGGGDGSGSLVHPDRPLFLLSSMLGSLYAVREIDVAESVWLRTLQRHLGVHRSTRSLVANHHASHRSFHGHDSAPSGLAPMAEGDLLLDGELLASFFTLPLSTQQQLCDQLPRQGTTTRKAWEVRERLQQMLHVQL